MTRYRLARGVRQSLHAIAAWIKKDRPEAAERVLNAILETLKFLSRQPGAGARHPELDPELRVARAKRPAHNYVVVYRKTDDGIEVVAVVHGARDWPRTIRNPPS
jgi:toxin ParE1/3/4